jgi:hypothetical protein
MVAMKVSNTCTFPSSNAHRSAATYLVFLDAVGEGLTSLEHNAGEIDHESLRRYGEAIDLHKEARTISIVSAWRGCERA